MLTITTKARTLNQQLSFSLENIPEGEYNVLIVLESVAKKVIRPLTFESFDFSFGIEESLSRDEIYGDDGR